MFISHILSYSVILCILVELSLFLKWNDKEHYHRISLSRHSFIVDTRRSPPASNLVEAYYIITYWEQFATDQTTSFIPLNKLLTIFFFLLFSSWGPVLILLSNHSDYFAICTHILWIIHKLSSRRRHFILALFLFIFLNSDLNKVAMITVVEFQSSTNVRYMLLFFHIFYVDTSTSFQLMKLQISRF